MDNKSLALLVLGLMLADSTNCKHHRNAAINNDSGHQQRHMQSNNSRINISARHPTIINTTNNNHQQYQHVQTQILLPSLIRQGISIDSFNITSEKLLYTHPFLYRDNSKQNNETQSQDHTKTTLNYSQTIKRNNQLSASPASETTSIDHDPSVVSNIIRNRRFRSRLRRVSNYNTVGIESNDIFVDDSAVTYGNTTRRGDGTRESRNGNRYNDKGGDNNGRHKGRNMHSTRHNNNNGNNSNHRHNYTSGGQYSNYNRTTLKSLPDEIHQYTQNDHLILMNQSLRLFNTSLGNNRNFSVLTIMQTGPTPEIFPLDDVTNSYGATYATNGTRERGNPGDPRRPYFPLRQETISTVESEFDISAVTEAPETGLSCYTCSASASNKSCYNEPNTNVSLLADVNIPSKQCDISQEFCMVSRVWFFSKSPTNRTEHQFSIERRCEKKCEPYCIMMGDRTRIEIYACKSCCNTPNCNTGNAAATPLLHAAALLSILLPLLKYR